MATNNLSWSLSIGGIDNIWGSVNLVIGTTPTTAMITDRYLSNSGTPMEGVGNWLDTYGDNLVLYMASDDAAGAGEAGIVAGFYTSNPSAPANDPYLADSGYIGIIPSRMLVVPGIIWSVSDSTNLYPYVTLAFDGMNTAVGLVRDDYNGFYSFAGGDSVLSDGWHTIGIGYDGSYLYTSIDGVLEATEVTVSSGLLTNLNTSTIGAISLNNQYGNFYGTSNNLHIGRMVIYDTSTLSGNRLSTAERLDIHNTFKRTYTLLP